MGKLSEIMNTSSSALLIVSAADLKDFAQELLQAARKEAEQQLQELLKERYLTGKEAAEMLCIDTSTLWRWRKAGYLHPVDVGGMKRYKLSEINNYLKSQEG